MQAMPPSVELSFLNFIVDMFEKENRAVTRKNTLPNADTYIQ